ncbi:MAG: hypothetical protein ACOYKD_05815 [Anaerolineaceae bacterium]
MRQQIPNHEYAAWFLILKLHLPISTPAIQLAGNLIVLEDMLHHAGKTLFKQTGIQSSQHYHTKH